MFSYEELCLIETSIVMSKFDVEREIRLISDLVKSLNEDAPKYKMYKNALNNLESTSKEYDSILEKIKKGEIGK
jgi:hypothetical protein